MADIASSTTTGRTSASPAGPGSPAAAPWPPAEPPALDSDYAFCRAVTARHGKSYSLATRLLPADRRSSVHALYAFARSVDDLVDLPDPRTTPSDNAARLDRLAAAVTRELAADGPATGTLPCIDERVSRAFLDTAHRNRIDPAHFRDFLRSMRMDIPGTPDHVARYRTMHHLDEYMHGSAGVIGLQMLPILGGGPDAAAPAEALGVAFQLTNFLRDVGEDLARGRVYLPLDEFAAFGVDEDRLAHARTTGRPDARVRAALVHFIDHTRAHYQAAEPGAAMLDRRPRLCVRAATAVYSEILTEIEKSGYLVFDRRIVVPRARRYALAAQALAPQAPRARRLTE